MLTSGRVGGDPQGRMGPMSSQASRSSFLQARKEMLSTNTTRLQRQLAAAAAAAQNVDMVVLSMTGSIEDTTIFFESIQSTRESYKILNPHTDRT